MKASISRLLSLAVVAIFLFVIAGCNGNTVDEENCENLSNIHIQIAFATDELMSQFESFHEYINAESGEWMIIWTDTPVTDFEYIKIGNDVGSDDYTFFFFEHVIHTIGELVPEKPFMVKSHGQIGTYPSYGVSFIDTNNVKRYFYTYEDMQDGSLIIAEFENKTFDDIVVQF